MNASDLQNIFTKERHWEYSARNFLGLIYAVIHLPASQILSCYIFIQVSCRTHIFYLRDSQDLMKVWNLNWQYSSGLTIFNIAGLIGLERSESLGLIDKYCKIISLSYYNITLLFLGAAEYNFTSVPHFTRFHWSNNTLSDVNSKRFSCLWTYNWNFFENRHRY